MDSESPLPPRESETRPPRKAAKRGPGNGVRIGALIALAVAGGLLAWVLVDRSDDEDAAQGTTATATSSLPSTPTETVTQPAIRTIAELRAMAAASSNPIYWAGARADTRLEVSETSSGTVFVRYLPAGSGAGDLDPHLTVATYARPNGYAEVQAAAKNEGSRSVELDGGGLAVYDTKAPTNLHLAFPGEAYQVEVFSPDGRPGAATRGEREDPTRPGACPVAPGAVQSGDAARAAATASSRELTPRARKRRRMWFLTVSVLRWSSAAICFVEQPRSRRRSTSTWRGVRCGGGAGGRRRPGVPRTARRRRPPFHRS